MNNFMRWFRSYFLLVFALQALLSTAHGAGRQLTGQYAPASSPPLPPEEAQKKFVVPDGFEVRLFAAEPDVINPVAMTWDERGRLWVVELYEYPLGAPAGAKPRDRIKILEDTDNDGRCDKVTIFADGLNLATGILLGYGGVFVGQAPDFLFLQDTNQDDHADVRTVLKTGFGLEDRHELLNGFTWGPDGWLYMTHGVFTHSKVRDPSDPNDSGVTLDAAVARYHPRTKQFEVYSEGTSNPWGVDFDRAGNAFVSACVIDHLFHMAPGCLYVRQGGTSANPYAYQLLPSIVDHKHFRAAYAGCQVYQGDQYPPEYRGAIFIGNIHASMVHQDRLTPNGSSFKASAEKDFLVANDGWFRPVSTQTGPDGALWIMDWYDKYPCYQNANADPEGVDREHGRIWRVVYVKDQRGAPRPSHPANLNLRNLSSPELVELLGHANVWQRRMAQRLLTERRDPATVPLLNSAAQKAGSLEARLAALWTLHGIEQLTDSALDSLGNDPEPAIRAWVARLTGERRSASPVSVSRLEKLAGDPDPAVRLAVATAARQFVSGSLTVDTPPAPELAGINTFSVLTMLIQQPETAKDPLVPFMIWMSVEPMVSRNPQPFLAWLREHAAQTMPLAGELVRKSMVRIWDTRQGDLINGAVQYLSTLANGPEDFSVAALDGLIDAQKAKALPPTLNTAPILASFATSKTPVAAERAQRLGALWGDAAATQQILARINDPNASEQDRIRSVQAARQLKTEVARATLLELLSNDRREALVQEAVRALGEIGGDSVADEIIKRWRSFSPNTRRIAADVLATRPGSSAKLLSAVERKIISSEDIPVTVIRTLSLSKDESVRQRAVKVIGRFRPPGTDKVELIARKKLVVLNGPVDIKAGQEVARKTCFVCHKLHGEGAEVGPDLTGVGRSSLDALLANVIDPNQVIGHGYENVEVETKDGRTLSGRLAEETETRVKLLSAGPKEDLVDKSDIASLRVSEVSVMPEGLEQMPDAEFRNLIWYIFNPPQDNKLIEIEPRDRQLVVLAKIPEQNRKVELVTYVMDPALRPYLHPVKDPTGTITLTQDKPPDHLWQHGIFTGLRQVNGIDFWTEKQGKQRFVRLLDIEQEPDRVVWRALVDWVGPDEQKVIEEEQTITVYRIDSTSAYTMDFDWVLRAPVKTARVSRYDYGGLSVRVEYDPQHSHLNANGQKEGATANQRAAWTTVSRPFGRQILGITLFDHPSNYGFPSAWRVDGQGLISPSPSILGDWTIEPQQERVFHYRFLVHAGPGDAQELAAEQKKFAEQHFSAPTLRQASFPDREAVALWNPSWEVICPESDNAPRKLPDYAGRKNVLRTRATGQSAAALERTVELARDQRTFLSFAVAPPEAGDWQLRVYADGRLLHQEKVARQGAGWKQVQIDLSPYAGKKVALRLEQAAREGGSEEAYWSDLQLAAGKRF